jgi:hypothetical protein
MKCTPRRSFPNLLSAQKKLALNRSLFCLSGEEAAPPNTLSSSAGFFTITELRACSNSKKLMLIRSFLSFYFQHWRKNECQVCCVMLEHKILQKANFSFIFVILEKRSVLILCFRE